MLVVKKFGGTSVADSVRIKKVANIIANEINCNNNQVVVVVSAMAGETTRLISQCVELSRLGSERSISHYDFVLGSGEVVAAGLLALALEELGIAARPLQAWQIPIYSNKQYGNAFIEEIKTDFLYDLINRSITPIITGFQAITRENCPTTLGRSGSDISAALIAAAINAKQCDIYTDVDGVYNVDPRIISLAEKICSITSEIMLELSVSGAQVLHNRAVLAALRYEFQINVLSSFTENPGTRVTLNSEKMEGRLIKAIAYNINLLKIDIKHSNEIVSQLFTAFLDNCIEIKHVNTNLLDHTFVITDLHNKSKCIFVLDDFKKNNLISSYDLNSNISIITITGYSMNYDIGFNSKIVEIFYKHDIRIYMIEFSVTSIKVLVDQEYNQKAIKLLHEMF